VATVGTVATLTDERRLDAADPAAEHAGELAADAAAAVVSEADPASLIGSFSGSGDGGISRAWPQLGQTDELTLHGGHSSRPLHSMTG
jgi:hypothetical protein